MNLQQMISAVLVFGFSTAALAQDIVVRAERIYTMAGETVDDGVIVVRDGKISAVGPAASTPVPAGVAVVDAAVVTPGLVDAHTVVGMVGYLSQADDQDHL